MTTVYHILRTIAKLILGRGVRTSYGQFGEDAVVQAMLKSREGFYVDVGAFDPVLYSNTYALYRRGWSGIVIDPNSDLSPLYRIFRPRDTFVHAAVGSGEAGTFFRFGDASYNTFNENDARRWQEERHVQLVGTETIHFRPLREILQELRVERIDFMNIDVESMDLAVLESHDWSVRPHVIAIEDTGFDADAPMRSRIYAALREKGYRLRGFACQTLIFADS